jgi:hypothetical protein
VSRKLLNKNILISLIQFPFYFSTSTHFPSLSMKKIRVMLASLLMSVTLASIVTSCKKDFETLNEDGTVNAAAVIQVGNPAGAPGAVTNITVNTTWTNTNTYVLNGYVRVVAPATLTIQEGTVIQGDRATRGTLIIERGAKIQAVGLPNQPIVFTSEFAAGARNAGDWGGVIICGNASINVAGQGNTAPFPALPANTNRVEGLIYTTDANVGIYGTLNNSCSPIAADAENSGTLQYVRIEYAGIVQSLDNESNGLTLAGVGNGTTIDHVQVSFSNDDGFEWFGGTVNAKYLFSYRNRDDDFDTDFGYQGEVQFGWVLRDPAFADNNKTAFTGVAVAGSGSNGFESDNNNVSGGNTACPRTQPIFSNITIIGPDRPIGANPVAAGTDAPYTANTYSAGYTAFANGGFGALIRRNSLQSLYNSVVIGWPKSEYNFLTPTASFSTTGTYTLNSLTTARNTTLAWRNDLAGRTGWTPNPALAFLNAPLVNRDLGSANLATTLGLSAAAWSLTAPNPRPLTGSVLLPTSSANGSNPAALAALPNSQGGANGTFTAANFRGAFDTAGTGWGNISGAAGSSWVRYFNYGG